MFRATFYIFNKEYNSTERPQGNGRDFDIVLKDGCDVLNPAISIQLPASESPSKYNYCYIPLFERYYYCRWKWENRLWTAYCTTDPMATYKDEIGASTQYVVRASSEYDGKVSDVKYPTKADVTEKREMLDAINRRITPDNGTYIIGIKSRDSNSGVGFYALNEVAFRGLVYYMFTDVWLDSGDIDKALQKMIVDPFDYIVSCNWYPFKLDVDFTDSIYFGYWDSGVNGHLLRTSERIYTISQPFTLPSHPQVVRGVYLNAAPYTQLTLDCYVFGRIALDPNLFIDYRDGIIGIVIDFYTGIASLKVESHDGTVLSTTATFSVPVQLSQVRTDMIKPVLSAFSAAVNYGMGNMLGTAASIASTVQSAFPQISSVGAVGSIAGYVLKTPHIDCYFYNIVDEDLETIGRPLCKVRKISSLSGFIQCDNAEVKTSGTLEENRTIKEQMEAGFFYK